MYNLLLTIAVFVACDASILTERQDIDRTTCTEISAHYGAFIECPPGFLGVELCGSGEELDCGDFSHKLTCCAEVAVNEEQTKEKACNTQSADFGLNLLCNQGMTVQGICGSGKEKDCNEDSHTLLCCDDHSLDIDSSSDNCVWLWGNYGQNVACPNIMVGTGYCNGGSELDCNGGSASHGIYCCPFNLRKE